MPHATSCGLDWPFTPKRREKKLAASAVREVTEYMTSWPTEPLTKYPTIAEHPLEVRFQRVDIDERLVDVKDQDRRAHDLKCGFPPAESPGSRCSGS